MTKLLQYRCLFVCLFFTSLQSGGTVPLECLSVPSSGAPPQVEAVMAVMVQTHQLVVGDVGAVDFLLLHGAVIVLHD